MDLTRSDDQDFDIIGIVFGSQSLASRGILVFPGFIHPGWKGHLIINAITLSPSQKMIGNNAVLAYAAFAKTEEKVENLYDVDKWLVG